MKRKKSIIGFIILEIIIFMSVFITKSNISIDVWKNDNNSSPKQLRIGYIPSPNGELLAKANGAIEKKFPDTKVFWKEFNTGREMITALAAGLVDIGTIGTPPAALGIANNLPFKVYYFHDIIGESEALIVKKDSGINSINDLKGKKIATTFNSTSGFSLINALRLNTINADDVMLIDMEMPDIIKAWEKNEIDGAYVWQTTKSKLILRGGKVVFKSSDLAKEGVITGEVGIVRNDFASKYQNFLKGYISVLNDSVHKYRQEQQESVVALSKELGLSKDQTLRIMNEIIVLDAKDQTDPRYLGSKNNPGGLSKILKDTGDYLESNDAIEESPDISVYQQAILNELYD